MQNKDTGTNIRQNKQEQNKNEILIRSQLKNPRKSQEDRKRLVYTEVETEEVKHPKVYIWPAETAEIPITQS